MPHSNVLDLFVFPVMSKMHGRRVGHTSVLKCDEIWKHTVDVWKEISSAAQLYLLLQYLDFSCKGPSNSNLISANFGDVHSVYTFGVLMLKATRTSYARTRTYDLYLYCLYFKFVKNM